MSFANRLDTNKYEHDDLQLINRLDDDLRTALINYGGDYDKVGKADIEGLIQTINRILCPTDYKKFEEYLNQIGAGYLPVTDKEKETVNEVNFSFMDDLYDEDRATVDGLVKELQNMFENSKDRHGNLSLGMFEKDAEAIVRSVNYFLDGIEQDKFRDFLDLHGYRPGTASNEEPKYHFLDNEFRNVEFLIDDIVMELNLYDGGYSPGEREQISSLIRSVDYYLNTEQQEQFREYLKFKTKGFAQFEESSERVEEPQCSVESAGYQKKEFVAVHDANYVSKIYPTLKSCMDANPWAARYVRLDQLGSIKA